MTLDDTIEPESKFVCQHNFKDRCFLNLLQRYYVFANPMFVDLLFSKFSYLFCIILTFSAIEDLNFKGSSTIRSPK